MSEQQAKNDFEREIRDYLNAHPAVSYADVVAATSASRWRAERYLHKLRRAGVLTFSHQEGRKRFYTVFGPRDAAEYMARKRDTREAAIWQAMRVLRTFTPLDIRTALADARGDISTADIQAYCSMLTRARYLAVLAKARPGLSPASYRLAKDTGPLPPVERRLRCIVDGNEDRIVYAQGERL